jgi:hypothetical protein
MGMDRERKCNVQHVIVPKPYPAEALLRVAAVQLPRQTPEDRAALLPYVKRDMR